MKYAICALYVLGIIAAICTAVLFINTEYFVFGISYSCLVAIYITMQVLRFFKKGEKE